MLLQCCFCIFFFFFLVPFPGVGNRAGNKVPPSFPILTFVATTAGALHDDSTNSSHCYRGSEYINISRWRARLGKKK